MNGVMKITLDASAVVDDEKVASSPVVLIPYFAWNNRGDGVNMNVWFGRDAQTVRASMPRYAPNVKEVKASYTYGRDDVYAIVDGKIPSSSSDDSIPCWSTRRREGKPQQVTLYLNETQDIECVSVYWLDGLRDSAVPASWSMEYRVGDEWKTFEPYTTDSFGILKGQFNMVHPFSPISADAIRLNVVPQPSYSVGILEIVVE